MSVEVAAIFFLYFKLVDDLIFNSIHNTILVVVVLEYTMCRKQVRFQYYTNLTLLECMLYDVELLLLQT